MSHGFHGVSNHPQLDCLFYILFGLTTNKTAKFRLLAHYEKARKVKNVSTVWCHQWTTGNDATWLVTLLSRYVTKWHFYIHGGYRRLLWHLTSRPRQNGHHIADDLFKCTSLNKDQWISIKISLMLVPKGPISNILALVPIMAWRRPGDKSLFELMIN